MDPQSKLTQGMLLPELKLLWVRRISDCSFEYEAQKDPLGAVCPKCATLSRMRYDKRTVILRDSPVHGKLIKLKVTKHRYFCKKCKKAFTEPLPGVLPRRRTTQRYRAGIHWACENFTDLKKVSRAFRCSTGFIYNAYYEKLDLKNRMNNNYPFTSKIGIDEHCFGRKKGLGKREFVTMIVDHNNQKLREVTLGKSHAELYDQLKNIPGRENVKLVTLDLSDSYKSFAKKFFPNAELIADRFHVQRLIHPIMHEARIDITGNKRKNPVRILLNKNRCNLKYYERSALDRWLIENPKIKEVYEFKEQIARFYRLRGFKRAHCAFILILDSLAQSNNNLLLTLRKTLLKEWRSR